MTVSLITDVQKDSRYRLLGCYHDKRSPRAISGLITFHDPSEVIEKCYERALAEGNSHFGIEITNECFTSATASETYMRHGEVANCRKTTGGAWLLSVYMIENLVSESVVPDSKNLIFVIIYRET